MKKANPRNNKKFWANVISYLFVPPTMNLAIFGYIALNEKDSQMLIFATSLVFGVVLPIAVFVYLRKKKLIANDDATIKEERTLPYFIGALLTFAAMYIIYNYTGLSVAFYVWLIYFITTISIILINKFWKISAHTMGVSIPLGILIFFGSKLAIIFAIILFSVTWARLTLKVHTPMQVLTGALFGSGVSILILSLR